MKNIVYIISIFLLALSVSCKKTASNKDPLLGNSDDSMSGRIATVTNNTQTKYGTFGGSASIEGNFVTSMNVKSFVVGGYDVQQKPTGMFFSSTTMDAGLEEKFSMFYGKSLNVAVNGITIPKVPSVPYTNVINTGNITSWSISKSKGLTLTWKVHNMTYLAASPNQAIRVGIDPVELPAQVDGATTVVAIVPNDLEHSSGSSLYWVVDGNAQTFTIDPSVLAIYGINESITVTVGTGTEYTYYYNNDPLNILSINTTSLPSLVIVP